MNTKAKIKVYQGRDLLMTAVVTMNEKAKSYKDRPFPEEEFSQDIFNLERYINSQGSYRCHTEIVGEPC